MQEQINKLTEENAQLRAELEAIGAGGVESLRKPQCLHQIQEPAPVQAAPIDIPAYGASALSDYLKNCDQHSIVPDVGGAFAFAFAAGFNLATSQTAPAAVAVPDEREAFEQWLMEELDAINWEPGLKDWYFTRREDGSYVQQAPRERWETWKARAALAAIPKSNAGIPASNEPAPVVLPEPAGPIIEKLLALARIVDIAVEDWGESLADGSMDVKFHSDVVTELESILDHLDSLPEGPDDNVIESGPVKAARILRALLAGVSAPAAQAAERGEVLVTVSGFTGSGKSAIAGEIEIMCRALGLQVEWPDGDSEKNMTHADWTAALELHKPRVRIVECNVPAPESKNDN